MINLQKNVLIAAINFLNCTLITF